MMLKIVALNDGEEETNEDEENVVSREAQEAIAETEYLRAIKLKSDGEVDLCFHLLKELLQTQVLNENINNKRSLKLWIIKFNCHKNIALILEERSEYILALQHYISAILIDSTDVSTLYKFGQLALKLNATDLAEYAFESCLKRNSAHWCAAEGMLQVMNINHNIIGAYSCATKMCQQNINSENAAQTLKEITNLFKQNLTFLQNCNGFDSIPCSTENNPEDFKCLLREEVLLNKNVERNVVEPPNLTKFHIKKADWYSVGQFIVDVYSFLQEVEHNTFFMFNLNDLIEQKNDDILPDMRIDVTEIPSTNMDKSEVVTPNSESVKCNEDVIDASKISTAEKSEVQPMDYNNYDSDSNLKSDGCDSNKTKPRRRCSDLHFLEQWGWHKSRRYSSRRKNERDDVDTSLNGYLNKMLIKYTKASVDDKWPFSKTPGNNITANMECIECKADLSEDLFNLKTKNEFEEFMNKAKEERMDLMQLTYKWLKYVSLAWGLRIPERLKILYIEIFKIYKLHFNLSTWNQLTPTNYEASFRLCILYLELSARDYISDNSCDIWRDVFNHLLFNIGNCHIISASNFESYRLKLIYLEYMLLNKDNQYVQCLSCLKQMQEILEQQEAAFVLHLPNLDNICMSTSYVQNLQVKFRRQIDINNIPKFYENGSWNKLTDIIISNIEASENQYEKESWLKDFCAQIEILLQSFWVTASYENCLIWSEKCFHFAVSHYLQEPKSSNRCQLLAETINFVTSYIEAIILNEGFHFVVALKKENLCRMVQNIIRILVYQFDGIFEKNSNHGRELNFKRSWVILHQLILREENDSLSTFHTKIDEPQDVNELIPKSFLILFTAHEYLGKRQWCTDDNGEFLQYVLDAVVLNLKAPVYDVCRDIIYEYLEQVTYCLFKYPQKKARLRHLEDHEANQIELNWSNAVQVFDLYRPEDLPEFNSYKLESITSDMEQLLLKVLSLMPKELNPSKSVHHVTMFIEGLLESPPRDSNAFKLPYKVLSLYYLLADFYFKSRDFVKAVKFYTFDLTVNPTRFDSWAGMALSKASKIETKLNGIDPISMENIWEECEEVLRCFECCINLNRFQTLLWIEYGSFSYTIHSCFSRYIKCNSKNISEETLSTITERKNKMLTIAYNCFSLATSLQNSAAAGNSEDNSDSNDEKWLCQYMLGKISEKRKEEPKVYLNHYLMAANYLYENGATYPIKINHSNPTMLSVEALEVFYRINAAIIKYLQTASEISRSTGELFNKVLKSLSSSPFAYNKAKIDGNSLNILKGKTNNKFKPPTNCTVKRDENNVAVENKGPVDETPKPADNVEFEDSKENEKNSRPATKDCFPASTFTTVASSTSTSVISSDTSTVESESESDDSLTDNENSNNNKGGAFTADELKLVYRMVVQNIEECATRFPEHYKSIYRLIYHYMNSPAEYCNLAFSEQLLLGQYKTSLGNLVNGLFYDRKNNNLFNGIWRIPSSEIDRPGSFSAHLVKCVKIFIQLLFAIKNHSILVDLAINLNRTPDLDKRYITDAERKELCQESLNCSIKVLRSILQKNVEKRNDTETLNLLIDIYKIHKKCIKYMNQKESTFAEILIDVYKFFIKDKVENIPDNCNFLDLAIKLCVQEITMQKNMEKSSHIDGTTNTLDNIVVQAAETANATSSRVIHIPGFNTRPKNRGNSTKASTATASNLSMSNTLNLLQTEFLKNSHFLSVMGKGNQLVEKDNQEFQRLFEEIYSKMLHNDLKICPTTSIFPQKPINYMPNLAAFNVPNSMGLTLPHPPATPPTTEASTFAHPSNTEETFSLLKHPKPKPSHKNKSIFKPYNRPVYCESNQNSSNDASVNYKTEIVCNSVNALSAYSNLFHHTTLSQIDLSAKTLVTNSKIVKDPLPETTTKSVDLNDFKNDSTSYKSIIEQSSSRYTSNTLLRNPFSNQLPVNAANASSPTKTLQEKLAERQKAYILNETNAASNITSKKDKPCDDIIVLD